MLQRGGSILWRAFLVAAAAVLAVALMWFPSAPVGRFLDQGWALGLGYMLEAGKQAGVDYVFTYGPLGYLHTPVFFPGLFWPKYFWTIATAVATAVVVVRFTTVLEPRWLVLAWLWLALAILPRAESAVLVAMLLAALLLVIENTWSTERLGATALLLAVFGLVKFTFFTVGALLIVLTIAAAPKKGFLRTGVVLGGGFVLATVGAWAFARQSIWNLPRYLWLSSELARGYSEAMAGDFLDTKRYLSAGIQVLELLGIAVVLRPPAQWRSRRLLSGLAMIAVGLFVSFKESFVRHDLSHAAVFFGFAAMTPVLVIALERRDARTNPLQGAALLVVFVTCLGALRTIESGPRRDWMSLPHAREWTREGWDVLLHPSERLRVCEDVWQSQKQAWDLPRVRQHVGKAEIDVATVDQSVAFLNDLNWRPRPVFQSYAAYTEKLAWLNGNFLRRPDAPRFVLVRWDVIDGRFPAHEDGPFVFELLQQYHPVLAERDYLLFERHEGELRPHRGKVVLRRRARFYEWVSLDLEPNVLYTLSIRIEYTAWGKLRRFVYRSPRVRLITQQEDPERTQPYFLIPDSAASEFVVNPLIEWNPDLSALYEGKIRRVSAVRLSVDKSEASSFSGSFVLTVKRYPLPDGKP